MTTSPMPQWLKDHLTALGRFNGDGVSRKAKLARCKCGGYIIVGLDHEPCGWPTTADPTHLDPLAELLALAAGRRTYNLTRTPSLDHRDPWMIRAPRRYPVLPDHRCRDGVPLRLDQAVIDTFIPHRDPLPEEAPF